MSKRITTSRTRPAGRFHAGAGMGTDPAANPATGLANCAIFSDLEAPDLERLLEGLETAEFGAGEIIFRRGDPGDSVLLIRSGSVVVQADCSHGRSLPVNVIKPGEIFGEIAVIQGTTRSATVTAIEACELVVIPQAVFLALLVSHPGLGIRTLGTVAERLRHLTDFFRGSDA